MVVLVCGLPGSGKSYFASKLSKKIKAVYLNSDRLRKKMFTVGHYTEKEKLRVYDVMLNHSRHALKQGKNVVLDATFYKSTIRKKFLDEIDDACFVIEVRASPGIIRKRLNKPRAYSDADFAVYQRIKRQWERISQSHLVLISTDDNIKSMMGDAIRFLNQP